MGPTHDEESDALERAALVAEQLFALPEPWRTRFMAYIVERACEDPPASAPSEEDLLEWLCDAELNERIRLMLRGWTHVE